MSTTSSGTNSLINAAYGFFQKVANPANPASNADASYYPSINAVLIPILFSTTSYSVVLPQSAFIFQVLYTPDVTFNTGAFNLGTTSGGSQLLSGISLTSGSINTLTVPILPGNTQNVYLSITGSPNSGSGSFIIAYFPTLKAPLGN
jgi:hypothetical protein